MQQDSPEKKLIEESKADEPEKFLIELSQQVTRTKLTTTNP
jgi:hypothetical protein